ncbi:MAG: energy transducer TonB [Betaproteobacteria bacterium]
MSYLAKRTVICALLLAFPPALWAADEKELEEAKARLQKEIGRRVTDYQKSRVLFVTAKRPGPHQVYVASSLSKILRKGNLHYPRDARGRVYGDVRATFYLSDSGVLQKAEVDRSSGHKVLDDAIIKAIHLASPFGAFPPDLKNRAATLVVTQTFSFAKSDGIGVRDEP